MTEQPAINYLQPVIDGLPMRPGQPYAIDKLSVVRSYLTMAMTAVRERPWRSTYYIDLQAGPGKNDLRGTIVLGSPLLALTCSVPFEHYRFNEYDPEMADALKRRVSASPLANRVQIYQQDVNEAVRPICEEIQHRDAEFLPGIWSSFNIAFLDPEGLELHWETVRHLASMKRMDLIINFSTGGLNRTQTALPEKGDKLFGTSQWRSLVPENADASTKRRAWIDFYLSRLTDLGYVYQVDDNAEVVVRNSRNVQVYSIIFASKHELGLELWKAAVRQVQQPRLF